MAMTAVSLFSGGGGLDLGVDKAGFKTLCSVEIDPHCSATLRCNSRAKAIWQVDVRALDPERMMDVHGVGRGSLSLLYGGPPCQPFSQIGKRGGLNDPRGALAFEMVRFADAMRPEAALIEQVPNFFKIQTSGGERLLDVMREDFGNIGYSLYADILDASNLGLAQKRRRAIVVCLPEGETFDFPAPPASPPANVGAALSGLPPPAPKGREPAIANHVDVTPARDRERISFVPEGLWLSKSPDVPPEVRRGLTRKDTTKFRRLDRGLPAPTLRCGEPLYHPTEDRYITPREAARLQGFPDGYVFHGPIRSRTGRVRDLDQHRQVANAAPPPMAFALATRIRETLCLT